MKFWKHKKCYDRLTNVKCVTCNGPIFYTGKADSTGGFPGFIYECPHCCYRIIRYANEFRFLDRRGRVVGVVPLFTK